jgi:branched-chain amino acid transport system substrate-binding protein
VAAAVRRLVAACAALALVATGCVSQHAEPTIRIGFLTAETGTQQAPGSDIRNGFMLYLETHDFVLGGRKVELFTADEKEDATTSTPAALELVEKKHVQILAGTISTGASGGVAKVATDHRIPFVGTNGRPKLDDTTWVWHTSFLTEDFGASLGQYMAENVGGPVYVMGQDFPASYEAIRGFMHTFTEAGGVLANPTGQPVYTPMATEDYHPFLTGIKETGAKAIYGWYSAVQGVKFLKQYPTSAVADLPFYTSGATEGSKAIPLAGDSALGVRSAFHYAPNLDNPANRAFLAAWNAKYPDVVPSGLSVSAYDAGAVLDRALDAVGDNPSSEDINKAIAGLGKVDSPRGEWEFGPKTHTPVQKWYLREVRRDGRTLSNAVIQDLVTLGS